MRVLVASHTSLVGGAERALLDLLPRLGPSAEATVACPPGPLAERVTASGIPWTSVPGTAGSLRVHPWRTPVAAAELGAGGLALARAARAAHADVLHANSIRAALSGLVARRLGGPPLLTHVHDCLPEGRLTAVTRGVLGRGSAVLVANSRHTARRFGLDPADPRVHVTYNPIDLDRFDPARRDTAAARAELGIPGDAPVLALVAQITPWKGQDVAVRTLAGVRARFPEALLLLAGTPKFTSAATRHDNLAYEASLRDLVQELRVTDAVRWLGEREDVETVLAASDIVLAPSWEEPFGRAVAEALAMGRPVVATDHGGPVEIVTDGREGRLLPPSETDAWTATAIELLADPEARMRMGRAGRERARAFDAGSYADAMTAAYQAAADSRGGRRGR